VYVAIKNSSINPINFNLRQTRRLT
jgi:hypothetical protein